MNWGLLILLVISGALLITPKAHGDDVASANLSDGSDVQCTMLTVVNQVRPANQTLITQETMTRYMTNLTPSTNSLAVASQIQSNISQKIADDYLKSDSFKNTSLGKTASSIETLSKASMNTGSSTKVDFKVKVAERQAVVTIQGPKSNSIKSEFIYVVDQASFKWILSKALSKTTSIAFTNVAAQDGSSFSSILSLTHSF